MRTHETVTLASTLLAMVLAAPAVLAAEGSQQPGQSSGMSQSGQYGAMQGAQSGIKAAELADREVVNRNGDQIGEVDKIVRDKQSRQLNAVVEVGGFIGMGQKQVTLPLSDLTMRNGKLVAPRTASTEDQLKSQPKYQESQFNSVSDDQQIERSDFAAFEQGGSSGQQGQSGSTGTQYQQDQQRTQQQGGSHGSGND